MQGVVFVSLMVVYKFENRCFHPLGLFVNFLEFGAQPISVSCWKRNHWNFFIF